MLRLHTFNILRGSAGRRPPRTWIPFSRFSTIFLKCLCRTSNLRCTHCIVPESLLNHPNSFHGGMSKLNTKFLMFHLLSHFECDSDTVHMLTQWLRPRPLTSTVKLSLFTLVHSSPLSLAARLHRCHADLSRYINNSWTFSGQTSYTHTHIHT